MGKTPLQVAKYTVLVLPVADSTMAFLLPLERFSDVVLTADKITALRLGFYTGFGGRVWFSAPEPKLTTFRLQTSWRSQTWK
jgi:hypothetical protein